MNTHRAHSGATTPITCWVRDDAGKRDVAGVALTVPVYVYGQTSPLLTLAGTRIAAGQVNFTVTASMSPGLYRFDVKAGDVVVYSGLLEVE